MIDAILDHLYIGTFAIDQNSVVHPYSNIVQYDVWNFFMPKPSTLSCEFGWRILCRIFHPTLLHTLNGKKKETLFTYAIYLISKFNTTTSS